MFNGVSLSGSSNILIQIGLSTVETTGYISSSGAMGNGATSTVVSSTNGFIVFANGSSNVASGSAILTTLGSNVWVNQHSTYVTNTASVAGGGAKTTSGIIDRIRITTVNGTDTFDAGSINIFYEG
jgi:hypothetical protein